MRRSYSRVAVVLVLFLTSTLVGQTTRAARAASRPATTQADPLTSMALPAAPAAVKVAKQPVAVVGGVRLETDDLAREIVAHHWAAAVEVLARRKILELELGSRKVVISDVDVEKEAARLLAVADPQAQWSHVAMTNPSVHADFLAQARDSLGWGIVSRQPGEEDADQADPHGARILKQLKTRQLGDTYKIRRRHDGDPLADGIAADVRGPDGKIDAVLDGQVLDHLRRTIRYDDLVTAREALIDDWLLGRELAMIDESISAADVSKAVTAAKEKHKPPFDWKMICQFKGTTPEKETAMFRRLAAWKKITGFSAENRDLLAFAKEREGHYRGEFRNVRQIVFRTVDALTGTPLDQGAQAQAAADANEAYLAIKSGADFAEVARTKSEDTPSASQGGTASTPFKRFGGAAADQPLSDAVFALTPEDPLSKPVKGAKGWYVFRLEKATPPNPKVKLEDLTDPNYVEWITSDYERLGLAQHLAGLRKRSDIKPGSDTSLTSGW